MNAETVSETLSAKPKPPRAGRLALIGTLLTLVGGVSYFLLMANSWIRIYAIPNIAFVVVGTGLCIFALTKKRSKLIIAGAAFSALLTTGFLLSLFVFMRLPPPQKDLAIGTTPPDFTLQNQDDRPVALSNYRGKGPVLLVFYRGFW